MIKIKITYILISLFFAAVSYGAFYINLVAASARYGYLMYSCIIKCFSFSSIWVTAHWIRHKRVRNLSSHIMQPMIDTVLQSMVQFLYSYSLVWHVNCTKSPPWDPSGWISLSCWVSCFDMMRIKFVMSFLKLQRKFTFHKTKILFN